MEALPIMAQLSPVFGVLVTDLNGDGNKDIFLGGNFFGLKPQTGRFDASYGTSLLRNAQHRLSYAKPKETGLFIKGEVRDIATIKMADGKEYIIVAVNNDILHLFRKQQYK